MYYMHCTFFLLLHLAPGLVAQPKHLFYCPRPVYNTSHTSFKRQTNPLTSIELQLCYLSFALSIVYFVPRSPQSAPSDWPGAD